MKDVRLSLQATFDRYEMPVTKTGCKEWPLAKHVDGYGQVYARDKITRRKYTFLAHRVAWFLANGEIPKDMSVLHKCDNRICVNPEHLFLGTHQDNMADMLKKGRQVSHSRDRTNERAVRVLSDAGFTDAEIASLLNRERRGVTRVRQRTENEAS